MSPCIQKKPSKNKGAERLKVSPSRREGGTDAGVTGPKEDGGPEGRREGRARETRGGREGQII